MVVPVKFGGPRSHPGARRGVHHRPSVVHVQQPRPGRAALGRPDAGRRRSTPATTPTADLDAMVAGVAHGAGHRVPRAAGPRPGRPWLPGPDAGRRRRRGRRSAGTVRRSTTRSARARWAARQVVDPELRVHGVAGLRVVDASRDADGAARQHQRAVIALAERAADLIRDRPPLPAASNRRNQPDRDDGNPMTTVDSRVETFDSTNPATGELVGRFPAQDAAAVQSTVDSGAGRGGLVGGARLRRPGRAAAGLAGAAGRQGARARRPGAPRERQAGRRRGHSRSPCTIDHLAWAPTHAREGARPAQGAPPGCSWPTTPRRWSTSRSASSA